MSQSVSARRRLRPALLSLAAFCLISLPSGAALGCASATPATPQGDHYRPNAPLRTSLSEKGVVGTRLVLTGRVLDHNCRSVLGALIDFWHADDAGRYDEKGFKFRGRQTTDTQGRYRLESIVPGMETGQPRAIHVKLAAPGGRVITTRLYFPGDATNAGDPFFQPALLVSVVGAADGLSASYDFVLPAP